MTRIFITIKSGITERPMTNPQIMKKGLGSFAEESSFTTDWMYWPPVSLNNFSTPLASNRSSLESMYRKNLSSVARSKRGSVNMGLLNRGNPLSIHIPKKAPNEANSTVNSNATGMNAGSEMNGFPEMMYG